MIRDIENLIIELVFVGNDDKLHIDATFTFSEGKISPELEQKLRDIVDG